MNANVGKWWQLHLRKARGETLSQEDQRAYEAEFARQDREAPSLSIDLDSLKTLRAEVTAFANDNEGLRTRWLELDREIRLVEKSLSQPTREALGVKD